jgi:hypothetical protein
MIDLNKVVVEFRISLLDKNLPVSIHLTKTIYLQKDDYANAISAFNARPQILREFHMKLSH